MTYIIFTQNIDPALLINMDETPLMWVPASQCTWGGKGAKNTSTHTRANNKSQSTGTPWLTYKGEIPFFHSTIKGKTEQCLPKVYLQVYVWIF